jgi:hypothetical protein
MIRRPAIYMTILLGIVTLAKTAVSAQRGHWVYLGNAHVDGGSDHDRIRVDRSEASRARTA